MQRSKTTLRSHAYLQGHVRKWTEHTPRGSSLVWNATVGIISAGIQPQQTPWCVCVCAGFTAPLFGTQLARCSRKLQKSAYANDWFEFSVVAFSATWQKKWKSCSEKGEIGPFHWISAGFFHATGFIFGPQLKCLLGGGIPVGNLYPAPIPNPAFFTRQIDRL